MLAVLDPASSFALVTLVFALIYKLMPRVRIPWSDVWVGALVTAGLFAVGRHLLGAYLGLAAVSAGFGAAGSLVVVLQPNQGDSPYNPKVALQGGSMSNFR